MLSSCCSRVGGNPAELEHGGVLSPRYALDPRLRGDDN